MAINVYLALFRKYNSQQLKALEWRYHLMAYGAPFIVALIYIFVETKERGHVYGPADVRPPFGLFLKQPNIEISFGAGCQTNGCS